MMITFLLSPLGRTAAGALALSIALLAAYQHVKGIGYAQCKLEWDAANAGNLIKGHAARADGERDAASGLRDGFDRDE